MKNLLLFVLLLPVVAFGQVQINKPLELTGSGLDARVMGIDTAVLPGDAVPLKMLKPNEPIYIGSITGADINAQPASTSVTITLPATDLPSGYVIKAIYLECETAFTGGASHILPPSFIQTVSPLEIISTSLNNSLGFMQDTGKRVRIGEGSFIDMSADNYTNGVSLIFGFNGGAVNQQNHSGKLNVWVGLDRFPATP